jgi:hypothetical protein
MDIIWEWNPHQTGGNDEPDLVGKNNKGIILYSIEATTSEKPIGVIDKRIKNTLIKIQKFKGNLMYFVRTNAMKVRAESKLKKLGELERNWKKIEIIVLE